MKRTFVLQDLDCANCAAKMERAIRGIDGVITASVSFLTQKLTIDAQDDKFETAMDEAVRLCRKIEPDCRILRK